MLLAALLAVGCSPDQGTGFQPESMADREPTAMIELPNGVTLPESFGANPYLRDLFLEKVAYFASLPPMNGGVAFVGDSLNDFAPWDRAFPMVRIRNFGISGDTTVVLQSRLGQIIDARPDAVFWMIGTNDLGNDRRPVSEIAGHTASMLDELVAGLPGTQVVVQSILPREPILNDSIVDLNQRLQALAEERGLLYLDLHSRFLAPGGRLNPALTHDGVHLNGQGYALWASLIDHLVRTGKVDSIQP